MEGSKIDGVDAEVQREVQTLARGVWIAPVRVGVQAEPL
jgi:hypothetical protein